MATLVIQSSGFRRQVIELKLGVNRFGRSPVNDFRIEHPTISARHCELTVCGEGLMVHDCGSTNGTFIEGEAIEDGLLVAGQTLRLGDVELLVETTEVTIAIPKFDVPRPAPPVVLTDGSLICPRHPEARATHQCVQCREVMCDDCVHRLRRRGGKLLKLCPFCSHRCEPIGGQKRKRKYFFGLLQKTVKLPFLNPKAPPDEE